MKSTLHLVRGAFLALIIAGTLAACDSTTALTEDSFDEEVLTAFTAELTADLALSSSQQSALNTTAARFANDGADDPGFLWRLAAELATTLTDAQKDSLLAGQFRDLRGVLGQDRPAPSDRPQDGQRAKGKKRCRAAHANQGGSGAGLRSILTDEQRDAVKEIRESRRAELEALLADLKAAREAGDSAAVQAAHDAIKAIHEALKAEVDAWLDANLTQEQKDAIAAAEAEREAARAERQAAERAVMIEVLGITEAQADEILAAEQAFREALQGLDRSATDFRDQVGALRTDLEAAVSATISNDAAFEIWQIHQVLSHRARKHLKARCRAAFGGRQTGGGSNG
ncbi:MAG: hypothetical protein JJ896_16500 [Rhodothermales bacterium]|nr:hypothetical protein [Rhodothermales bacterium]MBO6781258.1 hypothetical protein [Rhodothermales bacterium]